MIINNPNYRSMPEQVDYLTDKQTETDTTLDELDQAITDVGDTVAEHTTDIENIQEDIETLDGTVEQNTEDISTLTSEVEAVSGRGGYLIPHNFETDTPTETQLNNYALSQITNITTPEEIFNGTRVTNLYNNHTWILNNTQDTDPVVFEWVDLGQSLVSIATENTLGVVKGSPSDFKCSVNNDGTLSVNGISNALNGKQDKLTTTSVEDGTIDKSIGFDNLGNIVKGSAGGGNYVSLDSDAQTFNGDNKTLFFQPNTNGSELILQDTGGNGVIKFVIRRTANQDQYNKFYINSAGRIYQILAKGTGNTGTYNLSLPQKTGTLAITNDIPNLYQHNIYFTGTQTNFRMILINQTSTPFDATSFKNFIATSGYTQVNRTYYNFIIEGWSSISSSLILRPGLYYDTTQDVVKVYYSRKALDLNVDFNNQTASIDFSTSSNNSLTINFEEDVVVQL